MKQGRPQGNALRIIIARRRGQARRAAVSLGRPTDLARQRHRCSQSAQGAAGTLDFADAWTDSGHLATLVHERPSTPGGRQSEALSQRRSRQQEG